MTIPARLFPRHVRHSTLAALATTTLALSLSACEAAPNESGKEPSSAQHTDHALRYVALGDSYASMGTRGAPHTGPGWCARASDNYPSQLQQMKGLALDDVTCQGALTDHVLGPRADLPPQLDAVDTTTDIITLSIGGNDAGFGVLTSCAMNTSDLNCAELHGGEIDQALAALPAKLDDVYAGIHRKAPQAKIFATAYMPLLAATDNESNCPAIEKVSDVDRLWLMQKISQINLEVEQAAHRAGAQFIVPPATELHTGCAPVAERWVDLAGTETGAYPMHPTHEGQLAMAHAIAERL